MAKFRVIEDVAGSSYHIERWCTEAGRWRSVDERGHTSYYSQYGKTEDYYVEISTEEVAVAHARHFALLYAPYQWIKSFTGPGGTYWVRAQDNQRALVVRDLRLVSFLQKLEKDNIEIVNEMGIATKEWEQIPLHAALARADRLARGFGRVVTEVDSSQVIELTIPDGP